MYIFKGSKTSCWIRKTFFNSLRTVRLRWFAQGIKEMQVLNLKIYKLFQASTFWLYHRFIVIMFPTTEEGANHRSTELPLPGPLPRRTRWTRWSCPHQAWTSSQRTSSGSTAPLTVGGSVQNTFPNHERDPECRLTWHGLGHDAVEPLGGAPHHVQDVPLADKGDKDPNSLGDW